MNTSWMMVSFTSSSVSVMSQIMSWAVVFFLAKNGLVGLGFGALEGVAWMASPSDSSSSGFPHVCESLSGQLQLKCPCFQHLKHRPSF